MSDEIEREINRYLIRVASYLGSEEKIDEIILELRTHIEDRAQELSGTRDVLLEDVWRAINELGEPREIAQGYLQPEKPNRVFISDDLYPYFLRAIGVVCILIILTGLFSWIGRGTRIEDVSRAVLIIELTIPAAISILFVAFIYLSREGYTYESLRWKVESFFAARKVEIQGLGDEFRERQARNREEKRLRKEWKRQRDAEFQAELDRKQDEARLQQTLERQRKFERATRPGQLGELFGAFISVALAIFIMSPLLQQVIVYVENPSSPAHSILRPAFFSELRYILVVLLTISAMIHFANFVMGKTRSLYLARAFHNLLDVGLYTYLTFDIYLYVREITFPDTVQGLSNVIITHEMMQIFLVFLILISFGTLISNVYKAATYP
jgi:hypothetical protein